MFVGTAELKAEYGKVMFKVLPRESAIVSVMLGFNLCRNECCVALTTYELLPEAHSTPKVSSKCSHNSFGRYKWGTVESIASGIGCNGIGELVGLSVLVIDLRSTINRRVTSSYILKVRFGNVYLLLS